MRRHKSMPTDNKVSRKRKARKCSDSLKNSRSSKPKATRSASEDLFNIEIDVFKDLCKAVNTPFSASMLDRVERGDWLGIANAPFPDSTLDSFPDDYLIQQVMRKNPRLPLQLNRKESAVALFHVNERVCSETNSLLRLTQELFAGRPKRASLAIKPSVLSSIRGIIKDILGPLSAADLEFVERKSRFGPGASYHCSSKDLTACKKLESKIGLTPSLIPFLGALEPRGWLETTSGYALTNGSKGTTVPKDAQIDRFIAIEPSLNMRWQLGIGALIRHRLKRYGLDLKHQAQRNQLRVRFAEICKLATIDLSSASDTVALEVVRLLLPKRWIHLLELFRSSTMMIEGKEHTLEKFSSMGNGFTFELESLIFLAISRSFDSDSYVYGDDIIVTQETASDVIRTLNIFGFSVNSKKTFLAGEFFESCGADYWRGKNVRPFYFKKETTDDTTSSIIRMANAVRLYAHRRNSSFGCDSRFLPAWTNLLKRCPTARSTGVPFGYGDVGIIRNFDEAAPTKLKHQHCGYNATTYTAKPRTTDVTHRLGGLFSALDTAEESMGEDVKRPFWSTDWKGLLSATQYGLSSRPVRGPKIQNFESGPRELYSRPNALASLTQQNVRGKVGKFELRSMPVSNWHELGPWL